MTHINLKEGQKVNFLGADGVKRTAIIDKEIGGGATSIVYKVKLDSDDGKSAVLKLYREADSKMRNYASEFEALRLFSQLPDPSTPFTPIFLGSSDESKVSAHFVVMELITAPSLEAHFPKDLLAEKDACVLGIQLFEFIQLLHENQKSYPDIKKENFRWQNMRLRVMDIGGLSDKPDPEMFRRDLFEMGLIFLSQCISTMPDFDRMKSRISGQPVAEILSKAEVSLSTGLKYIFSRLFDDDYDNRYQTAAEVVSDLNLLLEAHDSSVNQLCSKLETQIKELQIEILKPVVRWEKKKEVFIFSGILDSKVIAVLKNAGEVYNQTSIKEGIEKFTSSPVRVSSIFQEIINGDDWGSHPSCKDSAWRWSWACSAVKKFPEAREYLANLLSKVDENPNDSSVFNPDEPQSTIQSSVQNDPDYQYIQSQVQFLSCLEQKDLEHAEEYLDKLPSEYQKFRRGALDGLHRKGELLGLLNKIMDGTTEFAGLMGMVLEARSKLDSPQSAAQWWEAIRKSAKILVGRDEFSQAAEILHAGLTYPGYPEELTVDLTITKAIARIKMDLALGDVMLAALNWIKLAELCETVAEAYKQPILILRKNIYQLGDLEACAILEKSTFANWISTDEHHQTAWKEVKDSMQASLKLNSGAVRRLFDKLTSDKPVLGENMDFPVRLLIREHLETDQEVNYKKALLQDAFRQLELDDTLKDKFDKGMNALEDAKQKSKFLEAPNLDSKKKMIINRDLESYENELLQQEGKIISLEWVEERRKKIFSLMSSIYQLLRHENDEELQKAMQRALGLLGVEDPEDVMQELLTVVKNRSSLKKKLELFAGGNIEVNAVISQLQKEVFWDKNEFQRYQDYFANLLKLRKIGDEYQKTNILENDWVWIKKLDEQDFILPNAYWKNSPARNYLAQIVDLVNDLVNLAGIQLQQRLALAIFASKIMKKIDEKSSTLLDGYLEGQS